CCATRRYWCWTKPPAHWTTRLNARCKPHWTASAAGAPRSRSPTACPPCGRRTRSWCGTRAAPSNAARTRSSWPAAAAMPPWRRASLCRQPSEARSEQPRGARFQLQQVLLGGDPAAVTGQRPVRADHPVAGHDDRDRIAVVRQAYGACGSGFADLGSDLPVAAPLPVPDALQGPPAAHLVRGPVQHGRPLELVALTGEVLPKLLLHGRERLRGTYSLGGQALAVPGVEQAGEVLTVAHEFQRAHRGLDAVQVDHERCLLVGVVPARRVSASPVPARWGWAAPGPFRCSRAARHKWCAA